MPSKNTKKKLRQIAKNQSPEKEEITLKEETTQVVGEPIQIETEITEPEKDQEEKDQEKKVIAKKQKKDKEKKPSKIKQKSKELASELKKVTWPTFSQVAKKTGVVLVVVAIFAVVLLGIDKLLQLAYELFIGNLV